jgi:hypothetical protein
MTPDTMNTIRSTPSACASHQFAQKISTPSSLSHPSHPSRFEKILSKRGLPTSPQEADPSSAAPAFFPLHCNHPSNTVLSPSPSPSLAAANAPNKLYAHMALPHWCSTDSSTMQFVVLNGPTALIHKIALTRIPSGLDITVDATTAAHAQALQQHLPELQRRLGRKNSAHLPHLPHLRIRESDAQPD